MSNLLREFLLHTVPNAEDGLMPFRVVDDVDLVDRDVGHPSDDTDLMNTGMKCQRKNPRMPIIASTTQTGGSLCAIY